MDLETHTTDVVNLAEFEGLRDVALVGHSYGGSVVAGAWSRARLGVSVPGHRAALRRGCARDSGRQRSRDRRGRGQSGGSPRPSPLAPTVRVSPSSRKTPGRSPARLLAGREKDRVRQQPGRPPEHLHDARRRQGTVPSHRQRRGDRGRPRLPPRGRKPAFHTNRDGHFEVYKMRADGTRPVNLTNDPAGDLTPGWQPMKKRR